MAQRPTRLFALLAVIAITGCDGRAGLVPYGDAGASADGESTAQLAHDDAGSALSYPTRESYCQGEGPPIVFGPQGQTTCTGTMAQVAFRYALCSCEAFDGTGDISTDEIGSQKGAAALGINGALDCVGTLDVGGQLAVAGNAGLGLAALATVHGDLLAAGPIEHQDDLIIIRDAFAGGDFDGAGSLRIDGTLTQPAGKGVYSASSRIGRRVEAPVEIAPPCDCSAETTYDIAGFVRAQRTQNDNAAVQLDPSVLDGFVKSEKQLRLPCGRFYLQSIHGVADLVLEIEGRVALFVGGDVDVTGSIKIELDEGAELDLFIEKGLSITGGLDLGQKQAPSRLRIYVGGNEPIDLVGGSALAANLYAPHAELATTGQLEVFGALFVRRLSLVGALSVHYDRAILQVGAQCATDTSGGPAAPSCESCRDCGNQACVEGRCGACRVDADCCAPLLCREGRCLAPVL